MKDEIQQKLIDFIYKKIGKGPKAKKELAEKLGLSTHALYKRLEGRTAFNMQEVAILINTYQMSYDEMVIDDPFYAKVILNSQKAPVLSIEDYLLQLQHLIDTMIPFQEVQVTYAAAEVPIFYYFTRSYLGCFKLFIFAKHVWNISSLRVEDQFSMSLFSEALIEKMRNLWKGYRQLPSMEIWSPQIWLTTLSQIEYYIDRDLFFSKKEALQILMDIQAVILDMQTFILEGTKTPKAQPKPSFHVLDNRLLYSNNLIRVSRPGQKMLFITHDNPNYLYSEEEELMAYTNIWFDKLLLASDSLKRKKQIDDFFEVSRRGIKALLLKIESSGLR
ncbi:MAG: hypothetical protein GVX96_05400 [Bacteroidetes bacterium]|jgi:hypothetical protein|nr:hypothetical protein [Bacteroidota bacterium]